MRIYRYGIDLEAGEFDKTLYLQGDILSVAPARQGYGIDVWATYADGSLARRVDVSVIGTGHPVPAKLEPMASPRMFRGTCVMPDGLVWHVFAVPGLLGER